MTPRVPLAPQLTTARVLLFAGALALAASCQTPARTASPAFDVVSIKPVADLSMCVSDRFAQPGGRLHATCARGDALIRFAYGISNPNVQLIGVPPWMYGVWYSIDAEPPDGFPDLPPVQNLNQVRLMTQALLADRFKLVLDREVRTIAGYNLTGSGSKLWPADDSHSTATLGAVTMQQMAPGTIYYMGAGVMAHAVRIPTIVDLLTALSGRFVFDRTGLTGVYDFAIGHQHDPPLPPGEPRASENGIVGVGDLPRSNGEPDLTAPEVAALLGLRLSPGRGPVEVFIVKSVQRPSEN